MANWCDNRLTIKGHKKEIEKFLIIFWNPMTRKFSMKNVVQDKSNWGTPREISCYDNLDAKLYELRSSEQDEIMLEYETQFNPNNNFIVETSRIFKNLTFTLEHYEPGAGYVGTLTANSGNIININEVIKAKDKSNEKEYYELVLDLGFDDINYILKELDLNKDTIVFLKGKFLANNTIIDITSIIKRSSDMPEVE